MIIYHSASKRDLIVNNPINTIKEKDKEFEKSLEELEIEAITLSNTLTTMSNKIISLETTLRNKKIYIPFKLLISTILDKSKNLQEDIYLSWEGATENKKNFRLFLIKEENNEVRLKKPLIETNMQTRFEYIKYLNSFMSNFTLNLKTFCANIHRESL